MRLPCSMWLRSNFGIRRIAVLLAATYLLLTAAAVSAVAEDEAATAGKSPSVLVEVIEGVKLKDTSWDFELPATVESFRIDGFALAGLPHRYTETGVIEDRSNALVVRLSADVTLPQGEHRFLLRSCNSARLTIDGAVLATTQFIKENPDSQTGVPYLPDSIVPGVASLPPGHSEELAKFTSPGGWHHVVVEAIVSGKVIRPEIRALALAIERNADSFYLVGPAESFNVALTDQGWAAFAEAQQRTIAAWNAERRREASQAYEAYWARRHDWARATIAATPGPAVPAVPGDVPAYNAIDRFLGSRLAQEGIATAPLVDDLGFLRRVTLDTVGVPPSADEIAAYLSDPVELRRERAIDRLLTDPRWADHWVGYWQDVLAENPGLVKPKLNNTGPFRWWIYESFLDNKPIDRFVTDLVTMQGSAYYGGPAGFGMATNNDAPMAAKAHVIGQAFLGVQMKCARCHDAPFHDVAQRDLFSVAAMLGGSAQTVPSTSSIPLSKEEIGRMLVNVTLEPGSEVAPEWPFAGLTGTDPHDVPPGLLRDADDSRELLAATITSPENERFARVMVNRLWKRYLGRGLVEPVDDWEGAEPSHPELLDYLARELVLCDYDLRQMARTIFESHTYQRAIVPESVQTAADGDYLFASPARRRMSAEQLVDSLFTVAGKSFNTEPMTLDVEGHGAEHNFLNLGRPTRSWQFVTLANERDRPSLSLPRAQVIVDVLKTFGWRETRQDPATDRDDSPTMQQPALLANGTVGRRITRLSDDHAMTELCCEAASPEELTKAMFLRVLCREPSADEAESFAAHLGEGFSERLTGVRPEDVEAAEFPRWVVSWGNHMSAEANRVMGEMEQAVQAGDPPTPRLEEAWRRRAEDALWALVNSPEFVFVP